MFTPHRSLMYILNGLIVISLVLGGLAPVGTAQADEADKASAGPARSQNPEQKEEIVKKTALAPESQADEGKEVGDVWLTLDVSGPEEVRPGEEVKLQARLRNVGWATASGVHLRLREEPGMGLAGQASWPLPDLPAGENTILELDARVVARPGTRLQVALEATGGTLSRPTTGLYTAIVTQPEAEEWTPGPGAGLWRSQVGQVEIELPAGRDARIARLRHRGLYERDRALPAGLLHRFELEAEDDQGQSLHQFTRPLTLRWHYAEALPQTPLLVPPSFAWFNPETADWEPLPTRADAERGVIETEIDHFSLVGVLAGSQEAPDDPFKDARAELFTGGMEYRFPMPLFQRPNGLAPVLALSYSSKRYKAHHESGMGSAGSLVGLGWQLEGLGHIDYDGQTAERTLLLNGASYTIASTGGSWYAKQAPGLKIDDENGSGDGNWHVRTPDGIHYTYSPVLTYWSCDWLNNAWQVVEHPKRFMLTAITAAADDGQGEQAYSINISYTTDTRYVDVTCNGMKYDNKLYTFQALPAVMTYNGVASGNSEVVEFSYANRDDLPSSCDPFDCNNYDEEHLYYYSKYLTDITMNVNGVIARKYTLGAAVVHDPNKTYYRDWRLLLNSIQVLGKQGAALLPAITFSYIRSPGCHIGNNCQLQFIDSGQGGKAELVYNHGIPDDPDDPYQLIRRIITDTVTNSYVQEDYWRANWSDESAGFGFAIVTQVGDRSTTSDDIQDKHWFHNRAGDFITTDKGAWGLEKQTEVIGVNPAKGYTYAWRTYAQPPLPAGVTYSDVRWVLTEEEQHLYNQIGNIRSRISKTRYDYALDHQGGTQAGNLTRIQELNGLDTLLRTTERWYYPCLGCNGGRYIANRLAEEMVFDATSACKAYKRFHYDSTVLGTGSTIQDIAGRTHTSPPNRGLLTRVEAAKTTCTGGANRSGDFVRVSRSQYEPTWHNLTRSEDGLGRGTNYAYDAVFHVQVATTTNQAGQQIVADYGSDYFHWAFGLAYKVTDANLQDAFFTYDALGRVRTINRPLGDASIDEEWQYFNYTDAAHPRYVLHKLKDDVVSPGNGYQVDWTYVDGLGRTLQTQGEREDGAKSVLISRRYDFFGRQSKETLPYESATGPGVSYQAPNWGTMPQSQYTGYSYDGMGRPTLVTHPDGSQVKTTYDYLNTTVGDELNHQIDQVADALGRVVLVANYNGDGSAGQPYVLYGWASYEYDALDRLDKVILPDDMPGSPVRMDPTYNLLGQKTAMNDPDMGAWSYDYDVAGNLARQTDAKSQRTCFYYDALNRLKGKTYSTGTSACPADPGSYTVSYTYDEYDGVTKFGKGRRTGMVDGSGSTSWVYDQRGRATKETKVIGGTGGGTFVTQWTYDAADRVNVLTYPGGNAGETTGEQVKHTYNPQGLLETVYRQSPTPTYYYVGGTDYNALGQVELRKLGSTAGVLTTDYMYRTDNYHLQWIKTGPSSPYEGLQNLEYAYDAAGNVDWIKDYKAPGGVQTLDFTYDALNRLTNGVSSGGSSGAYNESYGYADNQGGKAGNLTSKTGLGNYTYGAQAAGCPEGALSKPHAVVTAGSYTFCYDQNGNMRRRTMGSNTYTLTYDAENRLTGVSGAATATFVYDGDGKRVKVTAGGVTTAYVGEHYEWTGSTSTSKKYYYADGARIAMRVGGTLSWLLTDHLGSTAVTANASGTRTGELWYKPWGEYRGTAYGTTPTSYRFTGQREDATIGLYFYGARYYDPVLGRFTQADTIVPQPGNPQGLNRYSYVLNNPLRFVDPSGHAECASEDCVVRVHPKTKKPLGMRQKWGIIMAGPWEVDNAWMVYEGMNAISERVDEQMGSAQQGDRWIRSTLGGTELVRWPNQQKPPHLILLLTGIHTLINRITGGKTPWQNGPTGLALPAHYPLLDNDADTIYFFDPMDETTPVHESGHIIDYRLGFVSNQMANSVAVETSPTGYGRTNQLEDFAETWKTWILHPDRLLHTDPGRARADFIHNLVVQYGK